MSYLRSIMAELRFITKEESKRQQEKAFLALSPSDRFVEFLKLCDRMAAFQTKEKDHGDNLVLERKKSK